MCSVLYARGNATAAFLTGSSLQPDEVWPAQPAGRAGAQVAGFRIVLTTASGEDFDQQVADTLHFFHANHPELTRLAALPAVGLNLFLVAGKPTANLAPGDEVVAWHCLLPAELILLAAEFGMGVNI